MVEAENENTLLAGGFWLVKLHEPGVALKPWPLIVPVPLTLMNPLTLGRTMEDDPRSNVNPSTLQRPFRGVEGLKIQGAVAIVTEVPTGTDAVKLPDRLTTVGAAPFPLTHPVTRVAVLGLLGKISAPPLIEMVPVI